MADRPTHELKIEGGPTLILNDYITGAENWQIRDIYAAAINDKNDAVTVAKDAEKRAFELVVRSIDNSTENIAERILALPVSIYREIAAAVTEIVEGKKKSETS